MNYTNCLWIAFLLFVIGCGNKEERPQGQPSGNTPETSDGKKPLAGLTTREGATLGNGKNTVRAVAFSPDGKTLASGAYKKIFLWDLLTGTEKGVLNGHDDEIIGLAFSPDSKTLASSSWKTELTIKVWDVEKKAEITTINNAEFQQVKIFTPDGKTVCGDHGGCWDIMTGKKNKPWLMTFSDFAYSSGADCVAASSTSAGRSTASVLDIPSGKILANFPEFGGSMVAVSKPAKTVVSRDIDTEKLSLWDFSGKKRFDLDGKFPSTGGQAAFSPDGKYLATNMAGGSQLSGILKVWDVGSGKELATLNAENEVTSVAFSKDGKLLAAGSDRDYSIKNIPSIRIWSIDAILKK